MGCRGFPIKLGAVMPNVEKIHFPRSIRMHPVVGFFRHIKANSSNRNAISPFCAFQELCFASITEISVPGADGSWMTVGLAPGARLQVDLCECWNWHGRDVKQFALDLHSHNLIDCGLRDAMLSTIRNRSKKRTLIPSSQRDAVLAKTSGRCAYCWVKLTTKSGLPHSFHADHVLPVNSGGPDDIANLIPSCAKCNGAKSAKSLASFLGWSDDDE